MAKVCVMANLLLTENAVILCYNFSLSDCHFSLIFLEGDITSPYCQGPAWTQIIQLGYYSKTCIKRPLKKDKSKILMTNGSLMKVQSIAECSPWSILQYFWPALSDNWFSKPIFDLCLSGRFTQVLLSVHIFANLLTARYAEVLQPRSPYSTPLGQCKDSWRSGATNAFGLEQGSELNHHRCPYNRSSTIQQSVSFCPSAE